MVGATNHIMEIQVPVSAAVPAEAEVPELITPFAVVN